MIKKIILWLCMLASFIMSAYGDDFVLYSGNLGLSDGPFNIWDSISNRGNYEVFTREDEIALVRIVKGESEYAIYDVIKKEDIRRDEYGFLVATLFGRDAHFLLGGNYVVFRFLDEEESGMVFLPETCQTLIEMGHDVRNSIIKVNCPSYLTEGTKRYIASSLTKTFINGGMIFNAGVLPWAEGEEGSGIGVTLSIQTDSNRFLPWDDNVLVIMNGYVDFYRPHLFKRNNRVKKILIKSTDEGKYFEQEYELKDVPEFQTIQLPRVARSVDMIIKEVYRGTHYDDTVISSLLLEGDGDRRLENLYGDPYYVNWKDLQNKN